MNDNAESASQQLAQLPAEARARHALGFESAKAELAELATKSKDITTITNKAGYDECHAKRMALKNRRLDIQRAGKAAREDAQAYSKAVIAVEKELVELIDPEESRLQALQKAWDDARELERVEAERAEAARIQAQQQALASITGALGRLFGADVATLELAISQLEGFDMAQFDEVFAPTAEAARDEALTAIRRARDERLDLDRRAEEMRVAEEQRRAQAAQEAEERRQQQEREDAERLARQQQEDAERAARQAEEDRQRAAQAEADRVERERVQAEQAARQAELDRQAAEQRARDEAAAKAQREAQERADQERRDREAAEQAEAAQRAAEAAEAAIQAATAREAMTEALELLQEAGYADHITTRKLAAVLAKETA